MQLAIEIDDRSHDQKFVYDTVRTKFLDSIGIEVIRFKNEDVLKNREAVLEVIRRHILKKIPSP
jgi:adenine-specific DNA-methyltransferase